MELEQCLKLLRGASSDTERMAGLMVVGKLIKSSEINAEDRKRVYDTIGFTFINRLLTTSEMPEGCVENPYHKIAVTMLACFCTDQQLALHPQLTSKVPQFNQFIQTKELDERCTLAEDSLQCLKALSFSPAGVQYLLKYDSLQALVGAYLAQNKVSEEAEEILLSVLGGFCADRTHLGLFAEIIGILSQEFRSSQDELKFKICDTLSSTLLMASDMLSESNNCDSWLKDISIGLTDIFSSKLDPARKGSALRLSAVLSQGFGMEWALRNGSKFLLLCVHLVVVEMRLAIEGKDLEDIAESSILLCSCFIILESAIVCVAQHSDQDMKPPESTLDTETLLQLHTVLTEALTSVLHLLAVASQCKGAPPSRTTTPSNSTTQFLQTYPIVTAAVRVLGAWLAEDSLTLSSDVYNILPFLMSLCSSSSPQQPDEDLLKFLLPGLSHMTVDDKARPVLIGAKLGRILSQYMEQLQQIDVAERLCLCCGVCMNICVSAPEVIRDDSDGSFTSITSLMIRVFTNDSTGEELVILNAIALFLMLTRRKGDLKPDARPMQIWSSVLKTLIRALASCPYLGPRVVTAQWSDISELCLIAMQELSGLAAHGVIRNAAGDCGACQQLTDILNTLIRNNRKEEEFQAIQDSVCTLVQALSS